MFSKQRNKYRLYISLESRALVSSPEPTASPKRYKWALNVLPPPISSRIVKGKRYIISENTMTESGSPHTTRLCSIDIGPGETGISGVWLLINKIKDLNKFQEVVEKEVKVWEDTFAEWMNRVLEYLDQQNEGEILARPLDKWERLQHDCALYAEAKYRQGRFAELDGGSPLKAIVEDGRLDRFEMNIKNLVYWDTNKAPILDLMVGSKKRFRELEY